MQPPFIPVNQYLCEKCENQLEITYNGKYFIYSHYSDIECDFADKQYILTEDGFEEIK